MATILRRRTPFLLTRCFSSSAYTTPLKEYEPAVRDTPSDLTQTQRSMLDSALRVDQAGEVAANYIYKGQLAVLHRDKHVGPLITVRRHFYFGCDVVHLSLAGYVGAREEASNGHG